MGFEKVSGVDKETTDLKFETKKADILISCVGKPGLIKNHLVKKGATVIDVGYSVNVDGELVGDVAFDQVRKVAGFITPVPGGIGPLSTVLVFDNLVEKTTQF
jgi:methylenetetrahydrofolate dehydrogenase (NADP+)/methenyltetrahydrofolate cyclohydrolase